MLYILPLIIISMLFTDALAGNSTTELLGLKCGNQLLHNTTTFVPNFVYAFENMALQLQPSGFGVAVTGSGPDKPDDSFALPMHPHPTACRAMLKLGQFYPGAFLTKGGEIFLGGCFLRFDNYSFLQEFSKAEDKVVCGNGTRKTIEFWQAVVKGFSDAIENTGYKQVQLPASGTSNESASVLANCWKPLSFQSCSACLKNASASLMSCLPSSEGFALNTGCIMRYAGTDFLNTKLENRGSMGPGLSDQKIQRNSPRNKLIIIVAVICSVVLIPGAVIGIRGCNGWQTNR